MIADRPPAIRVTEPERTLTLLAPGQKQWTLAFEAEDDYGLGDARADVTLAQGDGENVTVSERSMPLRGAGDAKRRRYTQVFDLAALGLAAGDDLIVRLYESEGRGSRARARTMTPGKRGAGRGYRTISRSASGTARRKISSATTLHRTCGSR